MTALLNTREYEWVKMGELYQTIKADFGECVVLPGVKTNTFTMFGATIPLVSRINTTTKNHVTKNYNTNKTNNPHGNPNRKKKSNLQRRKYKARKLHTQTQWIINFAHTINYWLVDELNIPAEFFAALNPKYALAYDTILDIFHQRPRLVESIRELRKSYRVLGPQTITAILSRILSRNVRWHF
jgi:hypothetical protein